jgi:glycosyltransferase involved in cell wall biosynthesis
MAAQAKQCNIIHIPSWYPTESNQIAGIFIKEFIEGIATFDPEINHIILTPIDTIPFLRHTFLKKRNRKEEGLVTLKPNLSIFQTNLLLLPKISRFQYLKLINRQILHVLNLFEGSFLIHSHVGYEAGLFAQKLKSRLKIDYMITEHMSTFPFPRIAKSKKKSSALITAFQGASKIISVSHNQAKEILAFTKCEAIVISNSINKRLFTVKEKSNVNQKVSFLTIGIPSHQKGLDILFRAIKELDKNIRDNSTFVIAGGGELLDEYKKMIVDLDITDAVEMIGEVPRSKIPQLLNQADVFVLVSRYESFGIVYIESLASGVPILASRNGGAQEIVNEKNGVFVNVEDVNGTKEAIEFMYGNYQNFNPQELRKDFENRFSQEVIYSKYLEIYKSLI